MLKGYISSVNVRITHPLVDLYLLHEKFSILQAYYETLKVEKPHIDITVFCPGLVYTDYLKESFTHEEGRKYGRPTSEKVRRMTVERCAYLMATSIANKLNLSFAGVFPTTMLTYICLYYPNVRLWQVLFSIYIYRFLLILKILFQGFKNAWKGN